MVWSLALCPDDAKQGSVVYGGEFDVVFLAEVATKKTTVIQRVSHRPIKCQSRPWS